MPDPATLASVQNVMGILFSSTSFMGMTNLMSTMPVVGAERVVYYREQGARTYNVFAYGFALAIVELPWILLQVRRRAGGRGTGRVPHARVQSGPFPCTAPLTLPRCASFPLSSTSLLDLRCVIGGCGKGASKHAKCVSHGDGTHRSG